MSRKVKAKYPKIDVGGKKKEKKSSLEVSEAMLSKYADTYNPTEQTEEDAKAFMQPGGENRVKGPAQQYTPGQQQQQRPAGNPQIKQVQQSLNKLKLTGADGKALVEDGIRGKNTNFAIQSFKTEYGMPQANDALVMYYIVNPGQAPNKGYAGNTSQPQTNATV